VKKFLFFLSICTFLFKTVPALANNCTGNCNGHRVQLARKDAPLTKSLVFTQNSHKLSSTKTKSKRINKITLNNKDLFPSEDKEFNQDDLAQTFFRNQSFSLTGDIISMENAKQKILISLKIYLD